MPTGAEAFDAVVVGGGCVGGFVADRIAEAGLSVAILEEHREIGEPIQCGGLVTPRVFELVDCTQTILGKIRGAEIFSPRGRRIVIDGGRTEAVVVDRAMFDRAIVEKALRHGATTFLGTQAQSAARENGGVVVEAKRGDEDVRFRARLLIGADGVRSNVAKWFNIVRPKKILPGFEVEMAGVEGDAEFVKLFLGSDIAPGFFGWIIPSGETARVGLCLGEGNAYAYLQKMLDRADVASFTRRAQPILYIVGGIPIGFARRSHADRVMVVGDAACQPKATSGGGIFTGLLCGKYCAEVAVDALRDDDLSARRLHRYHKAWTRSIGKELRKDFAIHESFARLKDDEIEDVFALLDNPVLLEIIRKRGDIDFPSKVGWQLVREEPRLLKFAAKGLRAMLT